MTAVDLHTHFFPKEWPDFDARFGGAPWPRIQHTGPETATIAIGHRRFRDITANCWDMARRLAEMDRDAVDIQVICATPVLFAYDRPVAQAAYVARWFNAKVLELCQQEPRRLIALAQVPLQDPDEACRVLDEAMAAGHRGVQIGNHVGPKNLDDEGILAFLQHCAAREAAVLVHPWDMMAPDRTSRYMMGWTVGMPAETHLAIVSMILGGGFDRLPGTLRLCFAHGGGSFAYLLGRLENAWREQPLARGTSANPPSAYLDRFSVDTAVFAPAALRLLIETMGINRVMLGSDYPFPLGERRVGALVRSVDFLDLAAKSAVLGGNARRFLGIESDKKLARGDSALPAVNLFRLG